HSRLPSYFTVRKLGSTIYPVNVMWFLGVHPDASKHAILPWYHEKSELNRSTLRGAPRFKRSDSKAVELHTQTDWVRLKESKTLDLEKVKRITVSPRDPGLIRSKKFLNELADFAKQHNAVIELKGGVLAHVFYILQRAGCNVEIFDLFGAKEESLVFKKVVRDKIPESIAAKGELVTQIRIKGGELVEALKTKLIEEAIEVMDAKSTGETIEELADVLEVLHALSHHLKIGMKHIEEARKNKRLNRGGFDEGKVLVKTTAPKSLSSNHDLSPYTPSLFEDDTYTEVGAVILEPEIRLHQDEREVAGVRERILEIGLPTISNSPVIRSTEFHLVVNTEQGVLSIPLIGEWTITRKKSESKIRLIIKSLPVQSKLELK
ncbi:MAG: nucleoside triphosphate pyrophosphohydrolase, partial [Pseudomonadota bacterium]